MKTVCRGTLKIPLISLINKILYKIRRHSFNDSKNTCIENIQIKLSFSKCYHWFIRSFLSYIGCLLIIQVLPLRCLCLYSIWGEVATIAALLTFTYSLGYNFQKTLVACIKVFWNTYTSRCFLQNLHI